MVQRSIILLLMMVVILTGCKDESGKPKIISSKDKVEMVRIPMISGYTKVGDPIYQDFYMDTIEVTVGQFKKFLKSSGYEPESPIDWAELYKYSPTDAHPMIYVSWLDATAYTKWAGKRLPTEAEWEFAARGGLVSKEFPWGDDESIARDYANYKGTDGKDQWDETTAPVGSFSPNGYGLYDMAGNVFELCSDWYDEDYYSNSPLRNPQGPSTGESHVLRGGSCNFNTDFLRAAFRNYVGPSYSSFNYGFRCVSGFPAAQQ